MSGRRLIERQEASEVAAVEFARVKRAKLSQGVGRDRERANRASAAASRAKIMCLTRELERRVDRLECEVLSLSKATYNAENEVKKLGGIHCQLKNALRAVWQFKNPTTCAYLVDANVLHLLSAEDNNNSNTNNRELLIPNYYSGYNYNNGCRISGGTKRPRRQENTNTNNTATMSPPISILPQQQAHIAEIIQRERTHCAAKGGASEGASRRQVDTTTTTSTSTAQYEYGGHRHTSAQPNDIGINNNNNNIIGVASLEEGQEGARGQGAHGDDENNNGGGDSSSNSIFRGRYYHSYHHYRFAPSSQNVVPHRQQEPTGDARVVHEAHESNNENKGEKILPIQYEMDEKKKKKYDEADVIVVDRSQHPPQYQYQSLRPHPIILQQQQQYRQYYHHQLQEHSPVDSAYSTSGAAVATANTNTTTTTTTIIGLKREHYNSNNSINSASAAQKNIINNAIESGSKKYDYVRLPPLINNKLKVNSN